MTNQLPLPRFIVIIDDDAEYVDYLSEYLRARGSRVKVYGDTESFLAARDGLAADFFIVDLMLPGMDGIDLVKELRARSPQAGILIVSGRLGADSFNKGMEAGADMFLGKPVRFDQIVFAIGSIQRRQLASPPRANSVRWRMDRKMRVMYDPHDTLIRLTAMEAALLEALASEPGETFSRQRLLEKVGSRGTSESQRNLDAVIYRLRRKVEQSSQVPPPFRTIHGRGYAIAGELWILD